MRFVSLVSSVLIMGGCFAQAQIMDLGGGNPPPVGQDPSDMPPPPVPPGPGETGAAQPLPPQTLPTEPQPYNPYDQSNWLPEPTLPPISPALIASACGLSMRGSAELRFGEPLFKSADFGLTVRVRQKVSDTLYQVSATTRAGAPNSVIENDTGSGTCTIDMSGRVVMNLRFNKRGSFELVSSFSLQSAAPRFLTFSGSAQSSIGRRALRLRAQ